MHKTLVIDLPESVDAIDIGDKLVNWLNDTNNVKSSGYIVDQNEIIISEDLHRLRQRRPNMFAIFQEAARVQCSKGDEYAVEEDPYRNYIDAGKGQGTEGWRYAAGRMAEKMSRLGNLIRTEQFSKDPQETMIDLINMPAIILDMFHRNE